MIARLIGLYHARCRAIDLAVLWPILREEAYPNLADARAAFAIHARRDRAWLTLGSSEIDRVVKDLR